MRWVRSLSARFVGRAVAGALLLSLATTFAPPVVAQSAADKATARQLATEGIELFKAGKAADALDKLQRAQSLFDAPVHLIYLARCHAQLGQFVEAAEHYRRLIRTQLPDNASQVFKDAVADAKKELPDVEPKIASLRIDVEPANLQGLEVKVDDAPVSAAALGVDRPANPGSRRIVVKAPGYSTVEKTVELKPGEKQKVALKLESDGSAPAGEGGAGGTGGGAGAGGSAGSEGGSKEPEAPKGNLGFLVGLRLGAAIPAGDLGPDAPMKDYFGPGGSFELRGGVRLFQRYSLLLIGSGESYTPGKSLENGDPGTTIKVTPSGSNAGVGFMYATPPGKLGFFGELDFLFSHRFEAVRDINWKDRQDCKQTLKAHGNALRLMGGLQVPLMTWLQLSPYAGVAFGRVSDFSADDSCKGTSAVKLDSTPWKDDGVPAEKDGKSHVVISLGVGGDVVFGSDKPSK